MYQQQHNKQINQNVLHPSQYFSNKYHPKQHQHYNPELQVTQYGQSQVSKFPTYQHWNQHQQLSLHDECQAAAQSLHGISQDTHAMSSKLYQQNKQYQQNEERQVTHQQRITPPPLDHRVLPTPINQYSLPINQFQSQRQQHHLRENIQYSSSSQSQYPSTSYSHHFPAVDQQQPPSFSSWISTKPDTQTVSTVSNSVCSQQFDTNVQFNQFTIKPTVDTMNGTPMASWHRPRETQQVLPTHQNVQSHSTMDSGSTASNSILSSSMPILQSLVAKSPTNVTNLISYLKEPLPLTKISPNTPDLSSNIDDQISVRKISPQEVRRQEAPLRDLKKMYRLQKQSENCEVFRKPKEKQKNNQSLESLKSVSPKHRIASPDSTLLPDISQLKTVLSSVPSGISDDNCEPSLSPVSDSDATVCYGKDDDDESLKRRCKDFDSPVHEVKPVSLKRSLNDGDVEYENIEKRIKMISPRRECDSTNEFVEEHMSNSCQDPLTPLTPDPVVGCVIYNDVFFVRYYSRNNNKFFLLNDIRPFLKQNKQWLKDIKPKQAFAMCSESEEKLLNYKYSGGCFSSSVTTNMKFVAFEKDPEIHCKSIRAQEFQENTVMEISDKQISAQDTSHYSDLIVDNTVNVVNRQINISTEIQPAPLTSVTLKNELDKLSGMAQEVIHSAFSSLLEECRSLKEENQKLAEKIKFKDEKIQSYEGILKEASSFL